MTLTRRWVARCDHSDCSSLLVVPSGVQTVLGPPRWDAGEWVNDQGWDAAPGRPETYCPDHFPERTDS